MILCDMLFNNGMYQDVVHVIQRRRDELLKRGMSTNRNQNCLLFGACYKLVSILCKILTFGAEDFTIIFWFRFYFFFSIYHTEYIQRF